MKRLNLIHPNSAIILSLAIILFCNASLLKGQSASPPSFISELNIKFDALEMKKIEKAVKMVNDADQLLQEANKMYAELSDLDKKERASSAYDDVLKKLFECSDMYKDAYSIAYNLFHSKNAIFWQKMERNNHHAAGMEKAKYYEGSALKNFNRSLIRAQQVKESDRYDYSLEVMNDAVEYEKLAVRDQGRSLQICTDFPVEYNYGWDDDKSLEEIVKIMKDPIVHEPPKDIFATVDKTSHDVDSSLMKVVIFKVQIAAHTMPLSQEYLNLIYKDRLPIDLILEEGWYKYSIGRYATFDEAEVTRSGCNIKKAFVVAYCDGKKIGTQEAIQLVEKMKAAKQQQP
jgi:hypothetical protein